MSFRQWLLLAFALVTAPLAVAALQALWALEGAARQSRETADHAVNLTAEVQRLAERTVAMERSARQFLVLDDADLLARYAAAWQDALAAHRLLGPALSDAAQGLLDDWARHAENAWSVLNAGQRPRRAAAQSLTPLFAQLHTLNETLAQQGRQETDRRSDALLAALDRQRRLIAALVLGAIALAVVLAFGLGLWLSRPMARIELAIRDLGDNRYDRPVLVRGPSDLRRLGMQLDWLRHRLAALETDKNRFVRHISHELKTPLASIREGVALLHDGIAGPLSDDQTEIVRILRDNASALQAQIEDLLRYQALASGAMQLQRRSVAPAELVRQVTEAQRLHWQAKSLAVRIAGDPPPVELDGEKMAMALANLLSNAVRFSPPGASIRWVLERGEAGPLRIDCIDQGPGVAEADAAFIFEPFYQGRHPAAGARHGSGIGLSIVHEIVQAHGGTVRLLPSAAGAHFRIELGP